MARNAKQQVPPPQWAAASFNLSQTQSGGYVPAQSGKGVARGGPVIGARSSAGKGAPKGSSSFQSAPSFSFFKAPGSSYAPPLAGPRRAQTGEGTFTTNAPGASFPAIGMPPADAPLAHCPSNASYAASDCQEELNLHPSLNNIKKNVPFEADATSILASAMGSAMATEMPAAWAERQVRRQNPLQKTESQLIMAQAQAIALQEQRRKAEREAAMQSQQQSYSQQKAAAAQQAAAAPVVAPFDREARQIRAFLAARPYRQKILLMRHGESEANISRRDVPDPNLTNLGLAQAKSWQETVGDFGADIVLVSPLRRAVQTACHAFQYEEVPLLFCRFAREIGWSCNENTIHSTPKQMEKMLEGLPGGDEVHGVKEALFAAPDDPPDEMASLQRLKVVLASRPERTIVVVCHFGVIAALSGCRAKNGDVYECEWGFNDELNVVMRHKTPLNEGGCHVC